MKTLVEISVPVEAVDEWKLIDRALEPLGHVSGSGMGGGCRDIEFTCSNEAGADVLIASLKTAVGALGCRVTEVSDDIFRDDEEIKYRLILVSCELVKE